MRDECSWIPGPANETRAIWYSSGSPNDTREGGSVRGAASGQPRAATFWQPNPLPGKRHRQEEFEGIVRDRLEAVLAVKIGADFILGMDEE